MARLIDGKLSGRQRVAGARKITAARQAVLVTSLIVWETGQFRLAQAALGDWKPVLANYSSRLTLQSAYTRDDRLSNLGVNQTSTIQAFRQSISLATVGYVYHPDLMLFRMVGKYGSNQTQTETNGWPSSGRGGFEDYELESKFFRAKNYTLELSTQKETPFNSLSAVQSGEAREESKVDFKYRKLGHRASLKYHNTTSTDAGSTNTTDTYDSYYTYSKPKLGKLENFSVNTSAGYQENGTTSLAGDGGQNVSQQGTLSNSFGYSICNFNQGVSGSTAQSDNAGSSYSSDTVGFNEGVSITLPWDFNSNVAYSKNLGNSSNTWPDPVNGSMLDKSITNNDHLTFSLTQSLYDSLDTEFSAKRDTSTTNRTKSSSDIPGTPVEGSDENTDYGMVTRYSKKLPRNSNFTASLSNRNTQRQQLGLSSEPKVYIAQEDNGDILEKGNIITLPLITDMSAPIQVDVLKNGSQGSSCSPKNNPQTVYLDSCWVPLAETVHYELDKVKFEITIGDQLRSALGKDSAGKDYYETYLSEDKIAYGPFTFRVTSARKAIDATVQTNQFGAGLALFQFISSNYQHSVTTQEGTYGNVALQSTVITDSVGLGVSLYDWSFHASRQWTQADALQTTTDLSLSYTKTKKFWKLVTVQLHTGAKKGWADSALDSNSVTGEATTNTNSNAEKTTETEGYSYSLSGETILPYIKASLKADNSYDYTKGTITQLVPIYDGGVVVSTRDTGINEQTSFRNSISLTKPFSIPWIQFAGSSYVRYRWQTQTTTDNDGKSDGGRTKSYLAYGVNAGRGWKFGATSINLNANYAITEDVFDENALNYAQGSTLWQKIDQTNKTTVMLTVVRELF